MQEVAAAINGSIDQVGELVLQVHIAAVATVLAIGMVSRILGRMLDRVR